MFYSHAIKTHFHDKGFTLSLVLKVIGTRKWSLLCYFLRNHYIILKPSQMVNVKAHTSQRPKRAELIPVSACVGVLLLPPGRDTSASQVKPPAACRRYPMSGAILQLWEDLMGLVCHQLGKIEQTKLTMEPSPKTKEL